MIHLSKDPASSHTCLLFRALFTVIYLDLEVTFPAHSALGDFSSCIIVSDIYNLLLLLSISWFSLLMIDMFDCVTIFYPWEGVRCNYLGWKSQITSYFAYYYLLLSLLTLCVFFVLPSHVLFRARLIKPNYGTLLNDTNYHGCNVRKAHN